ncbi:hypothetical protein J2R87_004203 [Bradyrhizobium elkanii]|nr:hypothetical protein [Bradyrhizobium elkanii]MCS4108030.1 hypothetical protein [Bradyrhizobium elkanii]
MKAIAADAKWRERGGPRGLAQDAMTRVTACPALFPCSSGSWFLVVLAAL